MNNLLVEVSTALKIANDPLGFVCPGGRRSSLCFPVVLHAKPPVTQRSMQMVCYHFIKYAFAVCDTVVPFVNISTIRVFCKVVVDSTTIKTRIMRFRS